MVGRPPPSEAGAGDRSSPWAWPPDAGVPARSLNFEKSSSKPAKGFDGSESWMARARGFEAAQPRIRSSATPARRR
eukprot:8984237-Pyramimonas_sp.AAC.1